MNEEVLKEVLKLIIVLPMFGLWSLPILRMWNGVDEAKNKSQFLGMYL